MPEASRGNASGAQCQCALLHMSAVICAFKGACMSDSGEELITLRCEQQLKQLASLGWQHPVTDASGAESVPQFLARHVATTVRRVLLGLPTEERVHAANHILESISTLKGAQEWAD